MKEWTCQNLKYTKIYCNILDQLHPPPNNLHVKWEKKQKQRRNNYQMTELDENNERWINYTIFTVVCEINITH